MMGALRTWLVIATAVSVVVSIAQAKTNYAYVANYTANTVSVVDTSNNTVVKTIPVPGGPLVVALNQAGTFAYIVDYYANAVAVIKTSTNTIVATIPVQNTPYT